MDRSNESGLRQRIEELEKDNATLRASIENDLSSRAALKTHRRRAKILLVFYSIIGVLLFSWFTASVAAISILPFSILFNVECSSILFYMYGFSLTILFARTVYGASGDGLFFSALLWPLILPFAGAYHIGIKLEELMKY